ncbi:TonB-dependent receptor [Adhaeribacter aerolatus]|uniref:TonB-dependent receptor n=1 Tax=Adhaeribacter aerolatus TaxID=670289 RepID=A0A512AXK3_9BACT|nr:outer membrane beta-barrel family protein [Adhaeribacter aerolatus]GEO04452.1 TonB-dependent receptor [Adhaeribacter aerolatus]
MKKLFLFLPFCCIILTHVAAQVPAGNAVIKGVVIDSAKVAPLGYVTVGVREAGKKEPIKSTYTQDNGSFEVTGLPPKAYEVVINYVGFKSRILKVTEFPVGNPVVNLGRIQLSPTSSQLKEVEVVAQKQLIKQDIDKITYDVEADPESKTMTALDMLRKVPLITVDAEDNIQLKGSGSYRVLVNGKTSSLFVRDPKEVLKSMPAHTIKNIEVITNPPAKYEAEGVGGIINIITVKKTLGGYNGSINLGARTPVGYNAGGYLTAKIKKFGFSGYYGHNYNESPSAENNLFRDDYIRKIRLNQRGINNNHGTFNYLDGNLSYELDSLNLITGNFSFNVSNSRNNLTQQVLNTSYTGEPGLSYNRYNKGAFEWHGYDVGLDYQRSFRKNKEQLFTLSYKFNNGGNDSDTDFRLEYTDRPLVYSTTQNNGTSAEHTVQADYVHPIGKNNLEMGLKTITRLNSSDYFYANLNPDNGQYEIDPAQSNNFDYHQDIFAGYTSYSFKKKDWGLKLGARLEQTRINADFASSGTVADQDYFNLIPSIALSRKLKEMKTMRLSYTQRIERPGLWYLNPYVNRTDPRNIYFGNPNLRAATNHSFDLSYSTFVKKTSVNTSLFYNFTNNSIQLFTTLGADSVARTTYGNIGKNQRLGLSFNTNMNLTKNLNLSLNASTNFVQLNGVITVADTVTKTNTLTPVSNNGITANVFGYVNYKFGTKWRASGNIGYNSPQILLQGTSAGWAYNSFSVTRMLFKKDKGSLNLSISSPFQRNRRFFNELQDTRFYQNSESFYVMRRLSLSFNYRFGKLQGDIARKKRGIKNDDVSGGGQGGGATN